jgi:hypothetical protein
LAGLIHLQGCNAGAAEASLSQALQLDPRCEVAGSTLALLKLDRGDLAGAQLLAPHDEQRPGMGTWVAAERARQAALRPTAGRNEPCPCGSGQKFKRCCHRRASLTLRQRVPVVIQRLWVFARDPQQRFATIELAAHALDRSRPDLVEALLPLPTDPFILDLAIHESGLGHDYLDERGPLLVDDERELLEAALAAQRRLWQVVAVLSHERLRVQDVAGGDPVEVVDMRDGQRHDTGELILARAVPIDGHLTWFGMPLEVLPSERDHLVDLLHDGGTDANRLAAWYGSRPSIDDLDATIDLADDNFPFDDADDPALAEAYRIIDARFAEHRPTVLDRR